MSDQTIVSGLLPFRVVLEGDEPGTIWHIEWGEESRRARLGFILDGVLHDLSGFAVEHGPAGKQFKVVSQLVAHTLTAWPSQDKTAPGHAVWRYYENCLPFVVSPMCGFRDLTLRHSHDGGSAAGLKIEVRLKEFSDRGFGLTCSACALSLLMGFTLGYLVGKGAEAR